MKSIRYPQLLLLFCLLITAKLSTAQVAIGQWREHLPYRKAIALEKSDQFVFCLTESGLFQYGLQDNSITTYSKTKGLSDSDISAIAWNEETETLIIAYANGNIDLLKEGNFINLPDIKNYALISEKRINSICSEGEYAYLATNFGIVLLNVEKEEISDTYFIGNQAEQIQIHQVHILNNFIYAASEEGLYQANLDSGNLADFNNWSRNTNLTDFERSCEALTSIDDQLFVSRKVDEASSEVYRLTASVWNKLPKAFPTIYALRSMNDRIYIVQENQIDIATSSGNITDEIQIEGNNYFRDILSLQSRQFIADNLKSMLEISEGNVTVIKPDGPENNNLENIYSFGAQTWAVSQAYNSNFEAEEQDGEFYQYENQLWTNYTSEKISQLENIKDIHCLTRNKADQSFLYAGSWGDGLLVLNDSEFYKHWNTQNSPLGSKGIGDLDTDSDGNLWLLDANSDQPVKVLNQQKEWTSLTYSPLQNRRDLLKLICLQNGDKWVLRSLGTPLFAFNENGSIQNGDDDVSLSFEIRDENGTRIGNYVYDMVEDQNNQVWVGTEAGVAIYSEPGNLFREGDFYAYRPIITIDESTQHLLSSEQVLSIAVDGGNQKWLGTQNSGVYYVSDSGDEQLKHFTSENSPLPSNKVLKITVNPETGEVFFLTDQGLISYANQVTEGKENYSNLYVYPNPVRETYRGDIVVSGLVSNSIVKITDVSGNLVWEGKSSGGQYVWNGRNFNGSRVHTGVYLIFCATEDGGESEVIKLLFVN